MPGPSDQEQLFLEYINETRLDPLANAARYITSYGPQLTSSNASIQNAINFFNVSGTALQAAYNALVAVGPVAWNEALSTAAEGHNAAMIAAQQQTHQAPGELSLGPRLTAAGYNFQSAGENVFAYTESVIQGHAGFMIDWGNGPDGMQSPAGHRNSIMNGAYTEVGIAMDAEPSSTNPLGPYVVTQDFGTRGKLFVMGVAYSDNDNNNFYSIGEGRADLTVQVAARNATSTSSGGYTVEAASGAATITLTGGGLASAVTVTTTISGENIKLDVVDGTTLLTSRSVSVSGPITELRALGVRALSLTTGAGSQAIIGTRADDTLDGGAGNDNLVGGLGNDTYKVDSAGDLVIENAAAGTDTVIATAGYYLFANIENLTLAAGAGNVFGVGNSLANTITGNANANLLLGGAGDDAVNGGSGDDQLFGEDGIDTLNGEAGVDFIAGGIGNDLIYGGGDADALYGEDGDDLLDGGDSFHTDILVGGAGNDTLDGTSGQANPDYDLLDGGTGNDTYWVDTGADLTFEGVGGGIDTVRANVTVANAGVYLYANVENLVLEGTTAFGVGNDLGNQLTGSASGNWLLGGAGNDRIAGLAGNDVLFGEGGADTFVFGAGSGADVIGDFAVAEDVIEFASYFTSFAQAQANFHQNGADGAIDLGSGNLIVLHGVTMANLTAANFAFVAAAEMPKAVPALAALSFGLEPPETFADHGLIHWQSEFGQALIL